MKKGEFIKAVRKRKTSTAITIGMIYKIVDVDLHYFYVIDDRGKKRGFSIESTSRYFEIVENNDPYNQWELCELRDFMREVLEELEPGSWSKFMNYPNFWEVLEKVGGEKLIYMQNNREGLI